LLKLELGFVPLTTSLAVKFAVAAALLAMQVYCPECLAARFMNNRLLKNWCCCSATSGSGLSGAPSFFHEMEMGKSPEMMLHDTCARIPSRSVPGNWNGAISGGSETFIYMFSQWKINHRNFFSRFSFGKYKKRQKIINLGGIFCSVF